jgi:hypothetical protein
MKEENIKISPQNICTYDGKGKNKYDYRILIFKRNTTCTVVEKNN